MTRSVRLSLDAPALAHGIGLFETMRVVRGRVVHVGAHFARMLASARALGFVLPTESAFISVVSLSARGVEHQSEAALRCVWMAAGRLENAGEWRMAATTGPIPGVTLSRRRKGRVLVLTRDISRSLPAHKLTSYAACVIGLRRAMAAHADEALFVDARGRVLEGTSTNVFAIAGDRLITPPLASGILPGVVRGIVIANAGRLGLRLSQRALTRSDLLRGAFLTGSLTTIAAIRSVDGVPCALPSSVLLRHLRALCAG